MKNRLLATLLALTAIPLFANSTTAQQPSKTDLLELVQPETVDQPTTKTEFVTYLKKIKFCIKNRLSELVDHEQLLADSHNNLGNKDDYIKRIIIWNKLFSCVPKETIYAHVDLFINFLCNEKNIEYPTNWNKPWLFHTSGISSTLYLWTNEMVYFSFDQNNIHRLLLESIVNEIGFKKQFHYINHRPHAKIRLHMFGLVPIIVFEMGWLNELLPKIEAKITELEKKL